MAIDIEVAYALPERQQCVAVTLDEGATARQAILYVLERQLILLSDDDRMKDEYTLPVGVYGQIVDDNYALKSGDRLEIYRPLIQDPKERRRRVARQNAS